MELSSLDIHYLVKEISAFIGSKVEKAYQWENEEIMLRFRSRAKRKDLAIALPGIIFITKKEKEAPIHPPGFCNALRNTIEGAILKEVYQEGFERILILEFEGGDKKYKLLVEAFKPGNVVLIEGNKILNVLQRKKFKDRIIAPNYEYIAPEPKKDPRDYAKRILEESDKDIARTIAVTMGFGGKYADEIIARAKIDSKKYSELKEPDKLISEIKNIFSEEIKPFINEKPYPIEMKTVPLKNKKETFSEAIEDALITKKPDKKETSRKDEKLKAIISAQQKRLKELEKESEEDQKKGEFLYEHFNEIQGFLDKAKKLIELKEFAELKEFLKKQKGFTKYDEKNKSAEFEFN